MYIVWGMVGYLALSLLFVVGWQRWQKHQAKQRAAEARSGFYDRRRK